MNLVREKIAHLCEQQSPYSGEVEVDESYFGPKRVKGKQVEDLEQRQQCLEYIRGMDRYIQKQYQIAQDQHYKG